MLSKNIRDFRIAKGLSQEELAIDLNVVRQTVSKWERGLSVPDSELLIRIAEELDTSVSVLLGETEGEEEITEIKEIAARLEVLNEQFALQNERRRKIIRGVLIAVIVVASILLIKEGIIHISIYYASKSIDEALGVIGGSAGPTQMVVATADNNFGSIFAVIAIVLSVVGLFRIRRR
ncbi:MAG: helix-turn-helix transcriptional regulator [Ruminococcaceae bacterium]|nr:helix-turn-helix transcriptional regulator [Oscillospiraceae bacterium]